MVRSTQPPKCFTVVFENDTVLVMVVVLARHSERGKKKRQTEEEVGKEHKRWTGLEFAKYERAVENREKMEETGCEIICGAPTTLAVKG